MKNVNFNVEHQRKGANSRQWLDDLYTMAHMPEEEENDNDIIYVDDEDFSCENDTDDDYIEFVDCDESFFDEEEDDLYLGDGFIPLPMGDDYYDTPIVIDEDYELDEHEIDIINGDGNNSNDDVEIVEDNVKEKKDEPIKEKEEHVKHKKSKNDIADVLCQSQHVIDSLKDLYHSDFIESDGDHGKKHYQNKGEGGLMEDITTRIIYDKDYDPGIIELPKQSKSLEEETISMDNERLEQSKIAQSIANDFMTNIQASMSPLEAEEIEEEESNMGILKAFEDDIFGNDLSVVIVPEQEYEEVEDYDYVDGSFDDWSLANAECVY